MIFLENEHVKASFATKGAELQQLNSKKDNTAYLWNGDPAYWGKFSPVLFPIVGAVKDNTYYYENQTYHLPRHGFARDMVFEMQQEDPSEVVFSLSNTAETLKVYPFEFHLKLRYKLTGATLSCTYEVSNPSNERPLLFSVGAHPAFAVPLKEDLQYTDYFLQFNKDEALTYHKIDSDMIKNETEVITLNEGKLPLKHELFYDDALVFKSLKSDCISIKTDKNDHGINFRFKNFPFFGVWAAKDANFVCLEPWCGIADGVDHNQNLEEKEGIIKLPPNTNWEQSWEVECF